MAGHWRSQLAAITGQLLPAQPSSPVASTSRSEGRIAHLQARRVQCPPPAPHCRVVLGMKGQESDAIEILVPFSSIEDRVTNLAPLLSVTGSSSRSPFSAGARAPDGAVERQRRVSLSGGAAPGCALGRLGGNRLPWEGPGTARWSGAGRDRVRDGGRRGTARDSGCRAARPGLAGAYGSRCGSGQMAIQRCVRSIGLSGRLYIPDTLHTNRTVKLRTPVRSRTDRARNDAGRESAGA